MKTKANLGAAICVAIAIGGPTCALAGPVFLTYVGRNGIHEGQGGEMKAVYGIDFWMSGEPLRKFQVLGSLTDRRYDSGVIGWIRMSSLVSDIAKATKQAGGDAVVLQAERDDVIGVTGFGSASFYRGLSFGSSWAAPVTKHNSRFIVVKYLPDDTVVPSEPSPPPPPVVSRQSADRSATTQPAPTCGVIQQRDGSSKLVPC